MKSNSRSSCWISNLQRTLVALATVFTLGCVFGPTASAAGPLSWTITHVDSSGNALDGISCPSASLCVTVDYLPGDIVTSTNPTGGAAAWTVTDAPGNGFFHGVSCPSASLCVVVSGEGNVVTSTNPTGGAAAWTNTHVEPFFITGVSCPSVSLCVAVDGGGSVVTSTNPTGGAAAWTVTNVDGANAINGISCQSVSLCVAVDSEGNVVTSTNPTGGASAWHVANVSGIKEFTYISCPSTTLCVADNGGGESGEGGGYIVTSTNPTGGSGAWTATHVDSSEYINGISCPSTTLCVVGDGEGNILTSTDPTGGAGAWAFTPVEASRIIGMSCPSTTLCFGSDYGGNVLVGTPGIVTPPPPPVEEPKPPGAVAVPPPPVAVPLVVKCVVPKLKGKTLAKAKKLLVRDHCKLGKVSSSKTRGKQVVVSQKPGAGKKLPAGAKVAVRLG